MNTTAGKVATELRRVADALDKEPEAEVVRPLCFFYPDDKAGVETLVRLLPHPLDKFSDGVDHFDNIGVDVRGGSENAVWVRASINRYKTCHKVQVSTKVEPAHVIPAHDEIVVPEREVPVYAWHCPPLLGEQ